MQIFKIVSGGQTGVDRAALDAALALNVAVGGWCPEGRKSEDGAIPPHYPLQELPGSGYSDRTRQNVLDSDGTVIIYFEYLSGGTELTAMICMKEQKPYLLIDASELGETRAAKRIYEFVKEFNIQTLNVAGPRASGEPKAYDYTKRSLKIAIEKITSNGSPI